MNSYHNEWKRIIEKMFIETGITRRKYFLRVALLIGSMYK